MTDTITPEPEYLKQWIGREETVHDVATLDLARKLHATLDRPSPVPSVGEPLPLLAHFCLTQPAVATGSLGRDGHPPKGGFLPPIPFPRRMWAGGRLKFSRPLLVGDEITRTSRIVDMKFREGRSGALWFVTVQHRLETGGTLILEEEQDIVYRDAPTGPMPLPGGEPAQKGEVQRHVEVSSVLLFRYSALTFNGHRIHYDRTYAVEVEHYPGLVVHGPLQATLLANLAAELAGKLPKSFEFRSTSPLFDLHPVVLNATQNGDVIDLWTARPGGPVAMAAKAVF